MGVPKYKPSKARARRRFAANSKIDIPTLSTCSNCGNKVLPHRVCAKCGFYKGKQVLQPEEMG